MNRIIKLFLFILIIILNLFNISKLNAENIAVINLNYILAQNLTFQDFLISIDKEKIKELNKFENEKVEIEKLKSKIDNDKIILTQTELEKLILKFNEKIDKYNAQIDVIEIKYNKILRHNETIILDNISKIVKDIASLNNIDLVLAESHYFMVTDKIDITNNIIEILNEINISFEYDIE